MKHEETREQAFNVAIPTGGSYEYTFARDGFYRVGCDIHPAMAASMFAATTPYTTIAGSDGRFAFEDVPPGPWTVTVYTGGKRLHKDVDVKRRCHRGDDRIAPRTVRRAARLNITVVVCVVGERMPAASQPFGAERVEPGDEIVVRPERQRLVSHNARTARTGTGPVWPNCGSLLTTCTRSARSVFSARRSTGIACSGPRLSIQTCASVIWPAN